ncbi:sensor histidine kinase, partial [Robinsoniella peoriensis]|uniref:sensor histidine kinase n=1 Tax=Robinsoniella peoriensis TaxID=180332 RepID=UPI003750883B
TEPARASEALERFSFYLRGNLDSLMDKQLISFEKEMFHVNNYLYLEKMRFPNKLHIETEILYQDFLLPPLTVQTIVENAVRHGIIKRKSGGTLRIKSERTDDNIMITIRDDGLGFDLDIPKEDGRTHVGIENVRSRLMLQCGGSLVIESEAGVGTTVIIILPQNVGLKSQ